MDLNDFYYFAMVVKHNGFAAAERATDITKAKLSRRIASLEKKLGLRLLQRNSRSLALTEAGYAFYMRCLAVVEEAEVANIFMNKMKDQPSGTIRISCPVNIAQQYLAPVLPLFLNANPEVEVKITETNKPVHMITDRFDVAIIGSQNAESNQTIIVRSVMEMGMILVASPDYIEANGGPSGLDDLPLFSCVSSVDDKIEGPATWVFMDPSNDKRMITLMPRLRSQDLTTQLSAIRSGVGIGLLPINFAQKYLETGDLMRVLPLWTSEPSPIKVAFPARQGLLPAVRAVIDHIIKHFPLLHPAK